jgi:hypothetical protein
VHVCVAVSVCGSGVVRSERAADDGPLSDCVCHMLSDLPTLVLANATRLIAHGRCYTEKQAAMSTECGGFHVSSKRLAADDGARPDLGPVNLCQKHSDDGGEWRPDGGILQL